MSPSLDDLLDRSAPLVAEDSPGLLEASRGALIAARRSPVSRRRPVLVTGVVSLAAGLAAVAALVAGQPGAAPERPIASSCQLELHAVPVISNVQGPAGSGSTAVKAANSYLAHLDVARLMKSVAVADEVERLRQAQGAASSLHESLISTAVRHVAEARTAVELRGDGLDPLAIRIVTTQSCP